MIRFINKHEVAIAALALPAVILSLHFALQLLFRLIF